ncbi:MAG: hypothetical protein OEW19_06305 [Acidobacteriota bacterium]|nr:hypothetical protein [Acidobacteriota bacterium]
MRRAVLEGGGDREFGFALFIRQGMAGWVRAWSACAVTARTPEGPVRGTAIAVPAGVRGEVTHLLVTMALGATREETHR